MPEWNIKDFMYSNGQAGVTEVLFGEPRDS